jgi:hypothetical protein
MWKAIWWKEWRETRWFIGAAAGLILFSVLQHCGQLELPDNSITWISQWIPMVSYRSYGLVDMATGFQGESPPLAAGIVFATLAIGLGLWQSLGESYRQTSLFLFHRPLSKSSVIAAKWMFGVVSLLVILGVSLAVGLWSSARPGLRSAPLDWIALIAWWQPAAAWTLLYSGAFLSGIRPARWWGSRLLPLVAMSAIAAVGTFALFQRWWWCGLVTLVVMATHAATLWLAMGQTEQRDHP